MTITLFGLSGSLRKESYSTAILRSLADAVAAQATIDIGDVGSLPLYDQDLDGETPPPAVAAMRQAAAATAGIVLVSPEYNYAMPGTLKNAIDWLSRPAFKSCLLGKPFLIVTSSPAFTGGVRAQAQLREAMMATGARPVLAGEIVIAGVHEKIENGRLKDQKALDFAVKGLKQLIGEVEKAA